MKNGFTLIELVAVVVILGVLAVIIVPIVMNNVDKTRETSYNQLISNIEQTTQLYIRNNKSTIPGITDIGNTVVITLEDLVITEGLKEPVIDPRSDREISLTTSVSILVKANGKYDVMVGTIIYNE
ncbi:MAG: prepilin-type N-terminal cleavage/methylation domain-containing protein [Bacilli bacterium]|jgi:prepilin-type N-terminal cleavage/methylation domain-containing protein